MSTFKLPDVIEAKATPDEGSGIQLREFKKNYILFWNDLALELNRLTHTTFGPQDGPPVSARALAILHVAIHDAYFGVFPYDKHPHTAGTTRLPDFTQYLVPAPMGTSAIPQTGTEAKDAVTGAALTVIAKLYRNPNKQNPNSSTNTMLALKNLIDSSVQVHVNDFRPDFHSRGYAFGVQVAQDVLKELEIRPFEPGADPGLYMPKSNLEGDYRPYFFDDDPSHPVRLRPVDPNQPDPDNPTKVTRPYHGPFYGTTAALFATRQDFRIADPYIVPGLTPPPKEEKPKEPGYQKYQEYLKSVREYLESVEDVHRMGGAEALPSTKRRPDQTATALFWAYDGVNLIGTPPRLYNQIIRQIAFDEKRGEIDSDINNAEFARLFALTNVAMADAGVFCWREKYRYELWRPLSGVRQDPSGPAPGGHARPFWDVLGAPATNSNERGFKPPFPAYPSGHATFGAAAFQTVRRFYHARDKDVLVPLGAPITKRGSQAQKPQVEGITDGSKEEPKPQQKPEPRWKDNLEFRFVSDELNGVSRELYQRYDPSRPITDQPGDVRTRLVLEFESMKHAIFSNAISRIWLGVHWNFDAFAAEDIMEKVTEEVTKTEGAAIDPQRPAEDEQLYQTEGDGSTRYKEVSEMDWFNTSVTVNVGAQPRYFGGVPLGMLIADDIFDSGMTFAGSLVDLSMDPPAKRPD